MVSRTREEIIGKRHTELLERVEFLFTEYRHRMEDGEIEFLTNIREKLNEWGPRTFISVNQLNRLTRMEADLSRSQFNRY